MRLMIALVVAMAIPVTGFAQWLNYPTAGVPRLADGKLNLAAPAPRTADGKPDLSGIWYLRALPCGPEGCLDYQPGAEFLNFGASLQGGLPYQPWAAQLVKGAVRAVCEGRARCDVPPDLHRRPAVAGRSRAVVVDDPKADLRPWTVTLPLVIAVDTELLDYFCMDNGKGRGSHFREVGAHAVGISCET